MIRVLYDKLSKSPKTIQSRNIIKILIFISTGIFICSCHDQSRTGGQMKANFGTWEILDSTVQFHTYKKTGLLDSTLKIWYHFRNNKADLHFNTLVTREYDSNGNLKAEKSFDYSNKSNKWDLTGKNIQKYDSKGNMVLDVELNVKNSKSTISTLNKRMYNAKNQEIVRFEIRRKFEPNPKNWTFDSVLTHFDDKKIAKYDTMVTSSFYDGNGFLVTETFGSPEHPTEQTLSSTYSQGIKQITFSTTEKGDTNIVYRYDRDGDLIRETREYKKILPYSIDTTWYRGSKEVKRVHYDQNSHFKEMKLYRYDVKGNKIGEITYK
jgi:hypothetical protein